MPRVVFVGHDGVKRGVDASVGESVMSAAMRNSVPGIVAECGGNTSCATCHVWVREEHVVATGTPGEMEEDLLDMGVSDLREGSRLSCQIEMTDDLDGLTVDVPETQP